MSDPSSTPNFSNVGIYANIQGFSQMRKAEAGIVKALEGSLENYETIIFVTGTISSLIPDHLYQEQREEEILRQREILNALKRGSHVCMLYSEKEDQVFKNILSILSIRFIKSIEPIHQISIKKSEFATFLGTYGISFGIFSYDNDFKSVVCTAKNLAISATEPRHDIKQYQPGEFVVGFTKKLEQGLITVLPFFVRTKGYCESDKDPDFITKLIQALDTHKKNIVYEPPDWIYEIKLKCEEQLQQEICDLKKQIEDKQHKVDRLLDLKSVLWLKGNKLTDACMTVINEFGIKTLKEDIGEEDFWILDSSGSKTGMCECKGKDSFLARQDISSFYEHRAAREKPDIFPSLLIANTYNKAKNQSEKDKPIDSNVIEGAVRNNILIIRTLDLIRLLKLFQDGKVSKEEIMKKITTNSGWIKVSDKLDIMTK